jgi:hypothetical protein
VCAYITYIHTYIHTYTHTGSPAATKPDYLCVLSTKNPEFVSILLSAAKTSQANGKQTVLVCMSDGVEVFRKVCFIVVHVCVCECVLPSSACVMYVRFLCVYIYVDSRYASHV